MQYLRVTEAIDSFRRSHPKVPFPVLSQGIDDVTRKPVTPRESLQPSIPKPPQTLADCADPEVAIAITQQNPGGKRRAPLGGSRFQLPACELEVFSAGMV